MKRIGRDGNMHKEWGLGVNPNSPMGVRSMVLKIINNQMNSIRQKKKKGGMDPQEAQTRLNCLENIRIEVHKIEVNN